MSPQNRGKYSGRKIEEWESTDGWMDQEKEKRGFGLVIEGWGVGGLGMTREERMGVCLRESGGEVDRQ